MVQDDFREGFAIEGQGDPTIRKEGADPVAKGWGEPEGAENVHKAVNVEVVEKSLDIEEEEGRDMATLDARLDRMDHAQHSVGRRVVVAGSKLTGGEELEARSVEKDAL